MNLQFILSISVLLKNRLYSHSSDVDRNVNH